MPGITLHFVLASRVLRRWSVASEAAPFDLDDLTARNAFYHGAVGPDCGYLPGGHRLLSDLAHKVKTGALTSRLIASARTPGERAFAWGWLTHVLADREIHPLIGRGVGELIHGCRDTFVAGGADPNSHLRVEMGVDCVYAARHAETTTLRLRPAFDDVSIAFLANAYEHVYGVALRRSSVLASHLGAGRRVTQALRSLGVLGTLMGSPCESRVSPSLRWALRAARRLGLLSALSHAYLSPVRPGGWLLDAVGAASETHTELFLSIYRSGGTDVGDYDLDTGKRLAPGGPSSRAPAEARA